MSCTITSSVQSFAAHPYETIARDILGATYHVSLVFVGPTRAKHLNEAYRKKSYVPNVLSFPLDERHGEIYICPTIAKREAEQHGLSVNGYQAYLFIHGCLHLKGHDHGDTMEKLEQRYKKRYGIT
jgi:probable rRNA maturation factor